MPIDPKPSPQSGAPGADAVVPFRPKTRLRSVDLFAGSSELEILHDEKTYVLRQTEAGGLQLLLKK